MALTDLQLKQAAPRERDWKLSDGGGLYILIRTNGSKLWRMKYRQDGREQKLSFGRYPEVGLREARLKRDEARVEIGGSVLNSVGSTFSLPLFFRLSSSAVVGLDPMSATGPKADRQFHRACQVKQTF